MLQTTNYKIVDYHWFNCLSGMIGIVLVEDKNTNKQCYIGNIEEPTNDVQDAQTVIHYGTTFPLPAARYFFPYLE